MALLKVGDAELQVFTRDGRHLFGSELTSAQQSVMLSEQNGFVAGSTYSDSYLNGAASYRDQSWSLGSSATAVINTLEDGSLDVTAEALLRGGAMPSLTNSGASTMTVIAEGVETEEQRREELIGAAGVVALTDLARAHRHTPHIA